MIEKVKSLELKVLHLTATPDTVLGELEQNKAPVDPKECQRGSCACEINMSKHEVTILRDISVAKDKNSGLGFFLKLMGRTFTASELETSNLYGSEGRKFGSSLIKANALCRKRLAVLDVLVERSYKGWNVEKTTKAARDAINGKCRHARNKAKKQCLH